jgi:hypothetical protein
MFATQTGGHDLPTGGGVSIKSPFPRIQPAMQMAIRLQPIPVDEGDLGCIILLRPGNFHFRCKVMEYGSGIRPGVCLYSKDYCCLLAERHGANVELYPKTTRVSAIPELYIEKAIDRGSKEMPDNLRICSL